MWFRKLIYFVLYKSFFENFWEGGWRFYEGDILGCGIGMFWGEG